MKTNGAIFMENNSPAPSKEEPRPSDNATASQRKKMCPICCFWRDSHPPGIKWIPTGCLAGYYGKCENCGGTGEVPQTAATTKREKKTLAELLEAAGFDLTTTNLFNNYWEQLEREIIDHKLRADNAELLAKKYLELLAQAKKTLDAMPCYSEAHLAAKDSIIAAIRAVLPKGKIL